MTSEGENSQEREIGTAFKHSREKVIATAIDVKNCLKQIVLPNQTDGSPLWRIY